MPSTSVLSATYGGGLLAAGLLVSAIVQPALAEDFQFSMIQPLACAGAINPLNLTVTALADSGNEITRQPGVNLAWRGGIAVQTNVNGLRGLSDVTLLSDGRLLLVSDLGFWSILALSFDADNRLSGLTQVHSGPLKGVSGRNLCEGAKSRSDAESVTRIGQDRVLVGFERNSRFLLYKLDQPDRLGAAQQRLDAPPGVEQITNQGPEATAYLGDKRLITFSEGVKEQVGERAAHVGWISSTTAADWQKLYYERRDRLDPVAATVDGDRLLVLERAYFRDENLLRHRLVALEINALAAGSLVPSRELAFITSPTAVRDNLEGLAVIDLPGGGKGLLIVGDDNAGAYDQRTALLLFQL
jgi:hypothetical protein|tara:strand:- start:9418 stop:10488 length:1071 start_codon:yes stop_codon:yes gene_type:complete